MAIVLAYGSTILPMGKNVLCFIGVTSLCRPKSWETSEGLIHKETVSQQELREDGSSSLGDVVGSTQERFTPVPTRRELIYIETPVNTAINTNIPELEETEIIAIATQVPPGAGVPARNVSPLITPVAAANTPVPLVNGFDIEGFTSMCLAQGQGFIVEQQGEIYVCHCPSCQ